MAGRVSLLELLLGQYNQPEDDGDEAGFAAFVHEQEASVQHTDFAQTVKRQCGADRLVRPKASCRSVPRLLQARSRHVATNSPGFSGRAKARVMAKYLPCKSRHKMAMFARRGFCGTYSRDGSVFMSTSQDGSLRFFDTGDGRFEYRNTVRAQDVGWAVVDTAYSPDQQFAIYSSWSNYIHLITLDGERHEALPLSRRGGRICPFSIQFSQDSREIIAGTNHHAIYIYDIMHDTMTTRVQGHDDDINAVAFADNSSQIFFSGSDDMLCKVWDRRTMGQEDARPVGNLVGHAGGVTYIDAQGDGRHFISQGKDHTIKLWDIRKMSQTAEPPKIASRDYRFGIRFRPQVVAGDASVMTYSGHSVCETLIRARFSPLHTTGQKYIYSGSGDGEVYIFDALTGKTVAHLAGHTATVRDVSWHPNQPILTSTSWDNTIASWYAWGDPDDDEAQPLPYLSNLMRGGDHPEDESDYGSESSYASD